MTLPDTDETVLLDIREGIARVTLNRPQARNALTFAMYERLAAILGDVEADAAIKAVVLTGAGDKAFAAGTDIGEFRAFTTPEHAIAYEERIGGVLDALERCRVPTVAAIAGACTGGGFGIAAACDLRVCTADARFGLPIARTLGNCLSLANYRRFAALIGPARLKEMIFTARLVGAEEAYAIGLVHEVVEGGGEAALRRADELATTVASHAPLTLSVTKQALLRLRDEPDRMDDEDLVLACYMSADFREGMEAFLAKRPPRWTGR
jgi:enoyl-CoA hydratase/carnithine racemase